MPQFRFDGVNANGAPVSGHREAASGEALQAILAAERIYATRIQAAGQAGAGTLNRGGRITLAAVEEEAVAATVAELNWASVAPTVSYLVSGDEDDKAGAPGEIQLCANRAMAVGEGLSLGQLGHFLLSSLASFAEIFDVIAERFPQAVTWNETQEAED